MLAWPWRRPSAPRCAFVRLPETGQPNDKIDRRVLAEKTRIKEVNTAGPPCQLPTGRSFEQARRPRTLLCTHPLRAVLHTPTPARRRRSSPQARRGLLDSRCERARF
eukprot:7288859-Prymnesium_polylepis.1